MPLQHAVLTLSGLLLLALALLGLSLQLGWRKDLKRWPHHALFFAVCAALSVSVVLSWQAGQRWWALLPAVGALLSMPRTKPGRANHWQRALLCVAAFALGTWAAWRS